MTQRFAALGTSPEALGPVICQLPSRRAWKVPPGEDSALINAPRVPPGVLPSGTADLESLMFTRLTFNDFWFQVVGLSDKSGRRWFSLGKLKRARANHLLGSAPTDGVSDLCFSSWGSNILGQSLGLFDSTHFLLKSGSS